MAALHRRLDAEAEVRARHRDVARGDHLLVQIEQVVGAEVVGVALPGAAEGVEPGASRPPAARGSSPAPRGSRRRRDRRPRRRRRRCARPRSGAGATAPRRRRRRSGRRAGGRPDRRRGRARTQPGRRAGRRWRPRRARRPRSRGLMSRMAATSARADGKSSASSASSASQRQRAGVRRVHRQRARDLIARRRRVVTVVERRPRQTNVRVGVVGIDLEHLAERGLGVGGVVLLEQQRPPVEVGAELLAVGAHGVAQDVVGVLPVLVEADSGGDRHQVGRLGPIDLAAVPVGVARVDERLPGGAVAGQLVEPHERVAQRQIVGVGGRCALEPVARLRVEAGRLLGARAENRLRDVVGSAPEARAAEPQRVLDSARRAGRAPCRATSGIAARRARAPGASPNASPNTSAAAAPFIARSLLYGHGTIQRTH